MPATRISRLVNFGGMNNPIRVLKLGKPHMKHIFATGLAVGLGIGALAEVAKQSLGGKQKGNFHLSEHSLKMAFKVAER